jgi:hypothetical protein
MLDVDIQGGRLDCQQQQRCYFHTNDSAWRGGVHCRNANERYSRLRRVRDIVSDQDTEASFQECACENRLCDLIDARMDDLTGRTPEADVREIVRKTG